MPVIRSPRPQPRTTPDDPAVGTVRWQRHDWTVYEGPEGYYLIVPTTHGDEPFDVDPCDVCGGFAGEGEGIGIHDAVICDECSDAIMNLYHEKFSGKFITWPNRDPKADAPPTQRKAVIKPALRREVYERDEYGCRYCGARKNLSLDHVIPESRGGETTADNLVTCCKSCNSRKSARTPEEAGMTLMPEPDEVA